MDAAAARVLAEEAELERSAAASALIIRSAWAAALAAPAVAVHGEFGAVLYAAVLTLSLAALVLLWLSMRDSVYVPRIHPLLTALGLLVICPGLAALGKANLVPASAALVLAWKVVASHWPAWPSLTRPRFPDLRRWTVRQDLAGLGLLSVATFLVVLGWAI
jgi:hypothetical protein